MEFVREWKRFLTVIFNPIILIMLIIIIGLTIKAADISKISDAIPPILVLIVSLLSGVAANKVTAMINKESEGKILTTRGQSAVRGLGLILSQIDQLRMRTVNFIHSTAHEDNRNFQEIVSRCFTLEEQVLNSIDEWKDLIPEAKVDEYKLKLRPLLSELETKLNEIDRLKEQVKTEKGNTSGLNKKIKDLEAERDEMKSDIRSAVIRSPFGTSGLGLTGLAGEFSHSSNYITSDLYKNIPLFSLNLNTRPPEEKK